MNNQSLSSEPRKYLSYCELSEAFQVSYSTLSRWIAQGCPFHINKPSRKYLFNLREVKTWLCKTGNSKTANGFPSRRKLKKYWIFDSNGHFVEIVSGSRNAFKALSWFGRDENYKDRACAVDKDKNQFIAYGGKLRRYNPYLHQDDIYWDPIETIEQEDDPTKGAFHPPAPPDLL